MDTNTLIDSLRNLDTEALSWKFALYTSKKGRDGIELEWFLCNMQNIPKQVGLIRDYILKKPAADKPVTRYSPFLSDKENVFSLENKDAMIHPQLTDIFMSIRNGEPYPPSDFVSGTLPKIIGYAFFCENQVLFMRRGNPFISGAPLFIGKENDVVSSGIPVLKFNSSADFISIDGACYIFSSAIEKDLAFENRYFSIAEKCLDKLASAAIIGDYDRFENIVMKIKNAKKFAFFNEEILDYIVGLPITERIDYLRKYGVELDNEGKMETYEPAQSELIIDLLCGRSCLDPLNRLSVGSISPRE
jgi:hypothetical protein